MALTRKALAAMGIEPEKIDQIIEMHTDTVNGLKDDISKYKADAEQLKTVQKERDDLKAELAKEGEDDWKAKYEKVQKDFDDYKKADKAKEEMSRKTDAYKSLLVEAGVKADHIDFILKKSSDEIGKLELDPEGKAKDSADVIESIKADWNGFIPTEGVKGANVPKPPQNNGGDTLTREDIYKRDDKGRYVMDTKQRQEALAKLMQNEQKG
jgi:SMC interacting uncharacterized protein involved in chromosome segregation